MVEGKSQRVEVLVGRNNREEGIVVFKGGRGEAGFDDRSCYGDWVIFLNVQTARDGGENSLRDIMPVIFAVLLVIYSYLSSGI